MIPRPDAVAVCRESVSLGLNAHEGILLIRHVDKITELIYEGSH